MSNKSVLDSDVTESYELIMKFQYKEAKKIIDKKNNKVKTNQIDLQTQIKIVLLLYYHKIKNYVEKKKLIEELSSSIKNEKSLSTNETLMDFFYSILREISEESVASEIFKEIFINRYEISNLDNNFKENILKELLKNNDISEAYKVLTKYLIPNEKDKKKLNYYNLIKYEFVYNLIYKFGSLKEMFAKLTIKELLGHISTNQKNIEENKNDNTSIVKEKGFLDILVKYMIKSDLYDDFKKIFISNNVGFINSPVYDITLDFMLKHNDSQELILLLSNNIEDNIHKYNYINFERMTNYLTKLIKEEKTNLEGLENEIKKTLKSPTKEADYFPLIENKIKSFSTILKVMISENNFKIESIICLYWQFLNYLIEKYYDNSQYFNTVKSAILSVLNIADNLFKDNEILYQDTLFKYTQLICLKIYKKQSVLMEIIRFINKLSLLNASKLLESLNIKMNLEKCNHFYKDIEVLVSDNLYNTLFYYKLKMITSPDFIKDLSNIDYLFKVYLFYYNNGEYNKNLEKGERQEIDEIIMIIIEFYKYYRFTDGNHFSNDMFLKLLFYLNFSHNISPYNYEISGFLVQILNENLLVNIALQEFKLMNLKGPQFETCSYIVFKNFFFGNFKNGLSFIFNNLSKWISENSIELKKTFWKMMKEQNFWSSSEVIDFNIEKNDSYIQYLYEYLDISNQIKERIFNENETDCDFYQFYLSLYHNIQERRNKIIKNQDTIVFRNKFVNPPVFYNFNNDDYVKNIRMKSNIDMIYLEQEKNNKLGYDNNYLKNHDYGIFSVFNDINIFNFSILEEICSIFYNKRNKDDTFEKVFNDYSSIYEKINSSYKTFDVCKSNCNSKYFEYYFINLKIGFFKYLYNAIVSINSNLVLNVRYIIIEFKLDNKRWLH